MTAKASASPEIALRMFAKGAVSGRVVDWPQIKPALRWALEEIDRLRAAAGRVLDERTAPRSPREQLDYVAAHPLGELTGTPRREVHVSVAALGALRDLLGEGPPA